MVWSKQSKLPSSVQTTCLLCVMEHVQVKILCLFFHCLFVLGASQRTLLTLFAVTLRSTFPLLCCIPDCFDFSSDAEFSLTILPGQHAPQDPVANHEPGGRGSLTVTHEGRQGGGVRSWRRALPLRLTQWPRFLQDTSASPESTFPKPLRARA